ncbi:SIS domain-containing protein [Cellulomonas sp. URHE0023]|uniref:SIS domain-containing protein n=1 Tax=Cellulomonas sp. URHE0023 TaxID=1380354 RepID=UPI000484CED7|nr:SIS domain-containing protein [Cellulomonas sp. URHE0023]
MTSSITAREIASQPSVWAHALRDASTAGEIFGRPGESVLVLGCGTSAFVAESVAVLREQAGLGLTDAAYASEWRPGRRYDRVLVISRSGTTSEVLASLELVEPGTRTAAIVGVSDSPVAQRVDEFLLLDYADEDSVVQTRFPTTVLVIARTTFGEDLPGLVADGSRVVDAPLPVPVDGIDHVVYLGTGWTHGLAQEAALKVREAAQAWSESYPVLDYRHGPIAVAHPGTLVTIFGTADPSLVADIEATGARVLTSDDDPLVQLVQAQRFAVELAESRGLSPDTPRHLTRSVVLS